MLKVFRSNERFLEEDCLKQCSSVGGFKIKRVVVGGRVHEAAGMRVH